MRLGMFAMLTRHSSLPPSSSRLSRGTTPAAQAVAAAAAVEAGTGAAVVAGTGAAVVAAASVGILPCDGWPAACLAKCGDVGVSCGIDVSLATKQHDG